MTSRENHASQRVLLKIGLERRGERAFSHPDYASEGPMAWFEGHAAAWLAQHAEHAEQAENAENAEDAENAEETG